MSIAVMSFYKYISKHLYDQFFMLCMLIKQYLWKCIEVLAPPSPLVVCNAQRSEEYLIAKFSQLVKMKEIYLRCY